MIALQGAVQYRVTDPILFYVHVGRARSRSSGASRAPRSSAPSGRRTSTRSSPTRASTIATDALARTQVSAEAIGLGLEVLSIDLTDVRLPAQVSEAFLDVISAAEEKNTAINRAEAYAAEVLPRRPERGRRVQEAALGEAAAITARGEADLARLDRMSAVRRASPAMVGTLLRANAIGESLHDKRVVITRGTVPVWLEPAGSTSNVPATGENR